MSNPPPSAAEIIRKSPTVKSVASYQDVVDDYSIFTQWMAKQAHACEGINYRPVMDMAYIIAVLFGYYPTPDSIRKCLFPTQADKDRLATAMEVITGRISQLRYTAKSGLSKPASAYNSLLNMVINSEPYGEDGEGAMPPEGEEGEDDDQF